MRELWLRLDRLLRRVARRLGFAPRAFIAFDAIDIAGVKPGQRLSEARKILNKNGFRANRKSSEAIFRKGVETLRLICEPQKPPVVRRIEYSLDDARVDFEGFVRLAERKFGPPSLVLSSSACPKRYWLDAAPEDELPDPPFLELTRTLFADAGHSGRLVLDGGEPDDPIAPPARRKPASKRAAQPGDGAASAATGFSPGERSARDDLDSSEEDEEAFDDEETDEEDFGAGTAEIDIEGVEPPYLSATALACPGDAAGRSVPDASRDEELGVFELDPKWRIDDRPATECDAAAPAIERETLPPPDGDGPSVEASTPSPPLLAETEAAEAGAWPAPDRRNQSDAIGPATADAAPERASASEHAKNSQARVDAPSGSKQPAGDRPESEEEDDAASSSGSSDAPSLGERLAKQSSKPSPIAPELGTDRGAADRQAGSKKRLSARARARPRNAEADDVGEGSAKEAGSKRPIAPVLGTASLVDLRSERRDAEREPANEDPTRAAAQKAEARRGAIAPPKTGRGANGPIEPDLSADDAGAVFDLDAQPSEAARASQQ